MLFKAGVQLPLYPFKEVVGSAFKVSPEQIALTAVKLGVTGWLTVMVSVVFVAHCPAVGVKV